MKSKAVVFIGMAFPEGIIRHFALLGVELYKNRGDIDFYYASIVQGRDKGAWEIVDAGIPKNSIIEAATFDELVEKSVGLSKDYGKVVIHIGGGWYQTKHFVRARQRMDKMLRARLSFVGTTHSYRHDSLLRIPMSAFQYVLYRLFYKKIVFQCQYAADHFVGGNDLIQRGIGTVVPLGCELFGKSEKDVPSSVAERSGLAEDLLDDSLFKFVYLAAFRPGKMHVWLVHALAPVLRSHAEVRVLYCGAGERSVIDATMAAIREEGLERQILVPGLIQRRDVPWLLWHCQCAVVPSRSETFGHNFLEPMFAGLPVLGTPVGIGRDIIKDGETGYTFTLDNPKILQAHVVELLSERDKTAAMGENARQLVKKDFTHEAVAKKLMGVYKAIF